MTNRLLGLGESMKDDRKLLGLQTWSLNGQYSRICGGTSYMRQMSSPSLKHMDALKINGDDDDDDY